MPSGGFFSWGQFCSCTRTKHVRRRWKPSPSYRSCHHISKKATLLSAFLTWSQFPSILAQPPDPCPCQQLGVDEAKKKPQKTTSQVKFKDVFLLEAWPCCHKPRETFSCSTFFMVSLRVSSLPFSLHLGSTVTYCCTGCRPRPAGHSGVAIHPSEPGREVLSFLQTLCCLTLDGSDNGRFTIWTASFFHHPSQIMHSLKSQSGWPTVTIQELPVLPPTALVLMWPWRKHFIADCRLQSWANSVWYTL